MAWLVRSLVGLAITKVVKPKLNEKLGNTDFMGVARDTGRALKRDPEAAVGAQARLEAELGHAIAAEDLAMYLDASTRRYEYVRDHGGTPIHLRDWLNGRRA